MPASDSPRAVLAAAARYQALSAASGTWLAGRFHLWRGRSGRRYVVSAYPPDRVPDYEAAVVLAVVHGPDGPVLAGGAVCNGAGVPGAQAVLAAGADEVHLHLLATDEAGRAAVLEDLGLAG